MEMQKTNLQIVDILNDWDPFQFGHGGYEPEIADIVQAVHELDSPTELALRIQSIFEFSFEKILPLEECLRIANELLLVKNDGSCSI
ncbi:protein of unknown function [Bacillus sp. cl95]|nr:MULTISPECIES: DUF1871 family protein [unclassified Bacillus (in: firmicutes)]SFB13073.1 protein of unknown function [Bacillus sp. UNCCL13]SFQ90118.1 protein of unknown function [Bacillus sp. cl95]